jgi:hypothetical protein
VWDLDWQDCPVAFRLQSLARHVISVKTPLVFPPSDMPISTPSGQHRFIVHRDDAAKVLLLKQEVQEQTERYLETACVLGSPASSIRLGRRGDGFGSDPP